MNKVVTESESKSVTAHGIFNTISTGIVFVISIIMLMVGFSMVCQHKNAELVKTVEPTCIDKGYTVYHCLDCDKDFKKNYVDTLGHDFLETKRTDDGIDYECSRCGEKKSETLKQEDSQEDTKQEPTETSDTEVKGEISHVYPKSNLTYCDESGDMCKYAYVYCESGDTFTVFFTVESLSEMTDVDITCTFESDDKENTFVSDDKRFVLTSIDENSFEIKDFDTKVEYNLSGTYVVLELEYDVETSDDESSDIEFVSADNFRAFIGDNANIGKTVQFEAEVDMTFNGEYLLFVRLGNGKKYEVRGIKISSCFRIFPAIDYGISFAFGRKWH